jgi:hypothetical protein
MSDQSIQRVNIKVQSSAVDSKFDGVIPVLYVLAKSSTRFKEIKFDQNLPQTDILAKLEQWTNEKRVVRVFGTANGCFVQIHKTHHERFLNPTDPITKRAISAESPESEDLNDKDLTFETLNDDEYQEIQSAVLEMIEEDFEFILPATDSPTVQSLEPKQNQSSTLSSNLGDMLTAKSWKELLLSPAKIVQKILDAITKSVREQAELAKEAAKHDQIIQTEIIKQEIKHEIEKRDIEQRLI